MPCENVEIMRAPAASSVYLGGPATGKTATLAKLARAYADDGQGTLFVCASQAGASAVHAQLSDVDVQVLNIAQLAQEVLSDDEVLARFGRCSHILSKAERRVLMEDMKVYGSKRRRLRELLGFLERGFSDLADDDPNWVKTTEEEDVLALLFGNLEFSQGVLPSEASALAYKGLRDSDAVRGRHTRKHVLVDDFELLGRASHALVCAIAGETLDVAAGDVPGVCVLDPFPNVEGIKEFLEANPQVCPVQLKECNRPAFIVATLNALRADATLRAGGASQPGELVCARGANVYAEPSVALQVADGVVPEFAAVVAELQRALNEGVAPSRLFVAGVNPMWRANLKRYVQQAGIPVAEEGQTPRCAWLRAAIAEGDPLSASVQVAHLREIAQPQGLHLDDALQAYANGQLKGAAPDDPLLGGIVDAYWKAKGKLSDASCVAQAESCAGVAPQSEGVHIGEPLDVLGCNFDVVVFSGFVNGFIPSADYCDSGVLVGGARERAHAADVQAVYRCVASAQKRIVFTGFSSCSLEAAERLKLHIVRIRLRQGVRICDIEPSELASFLVEG